MHATPSVNRIAHLWLARVATSLRREALSNICIKSRVVVGADPYKVVRAMSIKNNLTFETSLKKGVRGNNETHPIS